VAELVWKGKGGGARRASRSAVDTLRVDELHGDAEPLAWRNRLVLGEAERVLSALLPQLAGKIALVYVDPPFVTGSDFNFLASIPGAPEGAPRIAVPAYSDAAGLDAWLTHFDSVARMLRDLLADGGSLYVHLDAHVAHYAKVLLDEVFGAGAFQREIVWRIGWVSGFKSRARNWVRNHDTILFYAKGGRGFTFHKEYIAYPEGYVRRDGVPPRGQGYPMEDVWNASGVDRLDSIQIMSFSGEKVGYPTQKNESLVARIVRASSSPGDIVLDCFAGSGTTAVVAEKLGRRWIACDASAIALHAARKRLLALPAASAFAIESAGGAHTRSARRKLAARVAVQGRTCTIELESFSLPAQALPASARGKAAHWSQWIEGWCVDWDHRGGALRVGSRAWRRRGQASLPLSVAHSYERPGRYVALVRAYDVLGGSVTRELRVAVK
jgi:16S rRNA G966 N2-methylase RsmD